MQGITSVAVLDGSSFTSNSAQAGGKGGAVSVAHGNLSCRTCHFELNWVTGSGTGGGAVYMQGTNPVAVLCMWLCMLAACTAELATLS